MNEARGAGRLDRRQARRVIARSERSWGKGWATVTIVATIAGALAAAAGIAGIREHGHGAAGSLGGKGDSDMRIQAMQAAVITAAAATTAAGAQDGAVQWRVEDGGNGHWYRLHPQVASWQALRRLSEATGGHPVTLTSRQEWSWVKANFEIPYQTGRFAGAIQDRSAPDYAEPAGGWRWVTDEPFEFDATYMQPFDDACGNQQIMIFQGCCNNFLDDIQDGVEPGCDSFLRQAIFEWSADCNNDGIVDYGQIRAGELEDANANNVPDCCEQGTPCNCPADLNGDGLVNGADIGAILAFWGPNPVFAAADITRDGQVNGADLGALLASWGACGS